MRRVSELTNEEQIGYEGLHSLIKLGVPELEVMKSGVMQRHLPNLKMWVMVQL